MYDGILLQVVNYSNKGSKKIKDVCLIYTKTLLRTFDFKA